MSRARQRKDDAFEADVRRNLLPRMARSATYLALAPDGEHFDVKFAVELGTAVLLDKPIIALAFKGRTLSPGLRRVAHEVVEDVDLDDPADEARVRDAVTLFMAERGIWGQDAPDGPE